MPKLPDTAVPSYRRHKQSGQAIVTLSGRDVLLGPYGTCESRDKYNRLIAEWLAAGRRLSTDPAEITVAEIVAAFRKHANRYYRRADDTPTGEAASFDKAFAPLLKLYARTPASSFGPLRLKAVRDAMIHLKWCRTQINKHVSRIRHTFKWAVENEMIEPSVCHGLQAVSGLRAGSLRCSRVRTGQARSRRSGRGRPTARCRPSRGDDPTSTAHRNEIGRGCHSAHGRH